MQAFPLLATASIGLIIPYWFLPAPFPISKFSPPISLSILTPFP